MCMSPRGPGSSFLTTRWLGPEGDRAASDVSANSRDFVVGGGSTAARPPLGVFLALRADSGRTTLDDSPMVDAEPVVGVVASVLVVETARIDHTC